MKVRLDVEQTAAKIPCPKAGAGTGNFRVARFFSPCTEVDNNMKLGLLMWLASALPQPAADQLCLTTTVYLEARSESQAGQMAVAEVAMRRREKARNSVSVCDVVKARGQFALSTANPNANIDNLQAWAKAWQVATRSITMWSLPPDRRRLVVPHADHFVLADSAMPDWIKGPPLVTIGAHNFYRIN